MNYDSNFFFTILNSSWNYFMIYIRHLNNFVFGLILAKCKALIACYLHYFYLGASMLIPINLNNKHLFIHYTCKYSRHITPGIFQLCVYSQKISRKMCNTLSASTVCTAWDSSPISLTRCLVHFSK